MGRALAPVEQLRADATETGDSDPATTLDQVVRLQNLVDNALRHARTQTSIAIDGDADRVIVRVSDDGPGIGPADRVFERFTRLSDDRGRDSGGAGLGLAISRQIARVHGGELELVHRGAGTCFKLRLPRASPR